MITIQKQLQEIDVYIQTQTNEIQGLIVSYFDERKKGNNDNLDMWNEFLLSIGDVLARSLPLTGYIKQHSMILRRLDLEIGKFYEIYNKLSDQKKSPSAKQIKELNEQTTMLRYVMLDVINLKDKEFNEGFFEKDCFQDKWFANKPYKDCCTEEECA